MAVSWNSISGSYCTLADFGCSLILIVGSALTALMSDIAGASVITITSVDLMSGWGG